MYNLKEFREYVDGEYLSDKPVLAWSLKSGYHFMTVYEWYEATKKNDVFKIVGVMK